jgi:hypothetical protein
MTVLLLDYTSHKQNDLVVFICKVQTVLEVDVAIYPTDRDLMLIEKQYSIGNAATAWNPFYVAHPEPIHTRAAMKELLYSHVAPTKHRTNVAIHTLCRARQGPGHTVSWLGT